MSIGRGFEMICESIMQFVKIPKYNTEEKYTNLKSLENLERFRQLKDGYLKGLNWYPTISFAIQTTSSRNTLFLRFLSVRRTKYGRVELPAFGFLIPDETESCYPRLSPVYSIGEERIKRHFVLLQSADCNFIRDDSCKSAVSEALFGKPKCNIATKPLETPILFNESEAVFVSSLIVGFTLDNSVNRR